MIVQFEQLKTLRRTVSMVDGAFDPLHHGHVEYFRQARERGQPLLCNIAPDSYLQTKHTPLQPAAQRALVIDALRDIDYVHVSQTETEVVLRELQPATFFKGKDWDGRLPAPQVETCRELGIGIVYLDTIRDSSSRLLDAVRGHASGSPALTTFERTVFGQHAIPAGHYDDQYFVSEWRAEGNDYTIETRRRMEGRHPELIKDVFAPTRVLDMGCGPGALLYLLQEQGIIADGVDFSEATRQLAPPEVRDRILIGEVTDTNLAATSYDLVICREVFEHLTVLQVCQAVRNLCRISARYVYVTTRFHPTPQSLLDVTTQFDVDPSHITLLNKDMLRLLFILEGYRCRPDLEERIDWMKKGRALVYERQGARA